MFPLRPDLLVSDADREAVADVLKAHYQAGRLTQPELAARVDAAYRARRESHLTALLRDLPRLDAPRGAARRSRRGARLPLRGLLPAVIALVALVALADALPDELSLLLLLFAVPMLLLLAALIVPMVLTVMGIVWVTRAITAPRRHLPPPRHRRAF